MRHLLRRLNYLLHRPRIERELAEEMDTHREMRQRALERDGLPPSDARTHSRRAMGNAALAQDDARDIWIAAGLREFVQDLRFAARLMARDRGFTIVACLALGLGIGVNNTQFAIVNGYCLRGLPIEQADRVIDVALRNPDGREEDLSYEQFEYLQKGAADVAALAAYTTAPAAIGGDGQTADRVQASLVSPATLTLLGREPAFGQGLEARDAGNRPVLLSDALWRTRYGGTRDVIGRTIEIDGAPATIVGVMPAQFTFPGHADLWMPIQRGADGAPAQTAFSVLGRLRDGATIGQTALEIGALTERLPARASADPARLEVRAINERFNGRVTDPAWIAFTIVGVLLVAIACANVANLLLMRSLARTREIAVRAAIGASRRRIVRQLLAESTLLAALGGLAGLALSALGLRLLLLIIPAAGIPYGGFPFDGRVLLVLTLVCVVTVFAFGLAPALHVSKTDVNGVLKSAGRAGTASPRARTWMSLFLTVEFGLTVLLVASIGLTVTSYRDAQRAAREHDISHLLTGWVAPPAESYATPEQRTRLYTSLRQRLAANPDVTDVAFAAALPFGPRRPLKVLVEGRALDAPVPTLDAVVDGGYFRALGISLLRGRTFTDVDGSPGHASAIVSKVFGDLYFGAADPIGRRIALAPATRSASSPAWMTIVGVAADVGAPAPLQPPPMLYVPFRATAPATALIMARTRSDPAALATSFREDVRALDPGLPLYRVMTMDRARDEALWMGRVSSAIITTIACIALLLAAVGLGAVTAHASAQRTAEIGIRIALGARRGQLVWMVLRRSLFHVTVGLALGIPLTFVWERLFVGPGSLTTAPILLFVIGVFGGVAALASLVPARRAIRLDPAAALRQE